MGVEMLPYAIAYVQLVYVELNLCQHVVFQFKHILTNPILFHLVNIASKTQIMGKIWAIVTNSYFTYSIFLKKPLPTQRCLDFSCKHLLIKDKVSEIPRIYILFQI